MGDVKISEFIETNNINNNDVLPVVQGGINKKISANNLVNAILDKICPVGKTEIFNDNEDHSDYLGFMWERTSVGRAIVGIDETQTEFNEIGKTGGVKTQALTVSNLPSMGFTTGHFAYSDSLWTGINITHTYNIGNGNTGTNDEAQRANVNNGSWHKYTWGSNTAHNNLQPYEVFAIWKRVA